VRLQLTKVFDRLHVLAFEAGSLSTARILVSA
jgi:hypothetical protein